MIIIVRVRVLYRKEASLSMGEEKKKRSLAREKRRNEVVCFG